jgi:phytoene dehydrogenase-like protein
MKYDVIVIGGGLSGLMAGITTAKKGKKTLLLERHNTVGGLAAGFTRKGYYFDSGMSRVMGFSIKGSLKEMGLLEKADLKPHRAIWNIEGHWIDYNQLSRFFDGLAELFPEERGALLSLYKKEVKPREKTFKIVFTDMSGMKTPWKIMHLLRLFIAFPVIAKRMSTKEMECDVLGKYLDKGGKAYTFLKEKEDEVDYRGEMSFVTKVGKWYTQMFNVYPSIGFQELADAMAAVLKDHSGEVRTSTSVRKITITNGRAVGVEVGKEGEGEELFADSTVCCVDLKKAFRDLIGTQFFSADLISRLNKSKLSSPIPILFLGLNIPPQRMKEHFQGYEEVFFYPAIETSKEEKGFYRDHSMIIHSSCFHKPGHAPANKSNLQVYLSGTCKGWMDNWGIKDGKRTDAYRDIKKMVIGQILGTLEKIIPELKDRSVIEVCELGTPFTIERYTGNTDGSALGHRMDEDYINSRKFRKYFDHYEGIENLYFAGQQTGYPGGVLNALGSGKHAGKLA